MPARRLAPWGCGCVHAACGSVSVCARVMCTRRMLRVPARDPSRRRRLRADAITELVMAGGMKHQIVATFNKIRG
jgi:hypothetical protein